MGLGRHFVEALIREHLHRPIRGDVVLVGRQSVYLAPAGILQLLGELGVDTGTTVASDIELDRETHNRLRVFDGHPTISDRALFRLLGVPAVLALDHSDYEGADIIHDLSKPLPWRLRRRADFIVDGSTLDNVFDPAQVIRNLAQMLRPGGRLLTTNMFSNHHDPYAVLPPLWFLDYFVANGFADCKVYVVVYVNDERHIADAFTINLASLLDPSGCVSAFTSPYMMATLVLAEKARTSTVKRSPSQQHYRSAAEWEQYRANLETIARSPRHHLVRSSGPIAFDEVRGGHLFMARDFSARDPMSEILARNAGAKTGTLAPPLAVS